jgi:hypothetical protein
VTVFSTSSLPQVAFFSRLYCSKLQHRPFELYYRTDASDSCMWYSSQHDRGVTAAWQHGEHEDVWRSGSKDPPNLNLGTLTAEDQIKIALRLAGGSTVNCLVDTFQLPVPVAICFTNMKINITGTKHQGRGVHIVAFVWLTLWETKNKKSYFRCSVELHTLEHSRNHQTKRILNQLQPSHHRRC